MILLASTSPTRQAMLRSAGLGFAAEAPRVDEKAVVAKNPQWSPRETALRLAEAKALDVSRRHPNALVIGADQVLALGTRSYGKPRDRAECRKQLMDLRNKPHALISAAVLVRSGSVVWSHSAEAELTMRDFSEEFIETYLDAIGDECTASVGGYKVEGLGVQLFQRISGDHFTILGLPLLPLLQQLRAEGEIAS